MTRVSAVELRSILTTALMATGFSKSHASALSNQTVHAEKLGQSTVGVSHVFDYIESLKAGRVNGTSVPDVSRPAPTMILVDARQGLPHHGFYVAFDALIDQSRSLGMCAFLQKNTTTCGSLGSFALRVAEAGLVCLAATNGPPLLAGSGSGEAVYCTNPFAFSAPQADGSPLLIDQSSSQTAFLNIRGAAESGDAIPEGWAVDKDGQPTTDPLAALEGTLLAYGGARGANIALMVEVLSAGLTGANWSLDGGKLRSGNKNPGTGMFVLAINPEPVDPTFSDRLRRQLKRLHRDYGVYIPGTSKHKAMKHAARNDLEIDDDLLARLRMMTA